MPRTPKLSNQLTRRGLLRRIGSLERQVDVLGKPGVRKFMREPQDLQVVGAGFNDRDRGVRGSTGASGLQLFGADIPGKITVTIVGDAVTIERSGAVASLGRHR